MMPFDIEVLFLPSLVIFVFTLIVSFRLTKSPLLSIALSFIKAGIFMVYFGYFFDGTYTFLDDLSYLAGGQELLKEDIRLTNLFDNLEFVFMVGRGDHFVYYLYNAYAFRVFGEGYYAPVAMNILLTLAIAFMGTRLAEYEFGMKRQTMMLFYVFLILHPDILAWSNVMNGKDILVLLLHVSLLASVSIYLRGDSRNALLLATPTVLILLFLRFYVPVLFGAVLALNSTLDIRRQHGLYLFISFAFLGLTVAWIGGAGFQDAFDSLRENLVNPIHGFVRTLLTPIPFNTESDYAFLDLPAIFHWLFFPFAVVGFLRIWHFKTPYTRYLVLYVFAFTGLYAAYGELQDPRHRVQLDYAWATLQFIGLISTLGIAKLRYKIRKCLLAT